MIDVQLRNADKLIAAAGSIPKELNWTMKRAFDRALSKYKVLHQKAKMKAAPPPLWKGRSPLAPGVLATKRHAGMEGFLSMFHVSVSGDRISNMVGKLATRRGMIAYRQEFGGSWAPGRIPLPPAKDARGRVTPKAKKLWKQRHAKMVKIIISGKEFWFAINPAFARENRLRKKYGAWGDAPKQKTGRLIPMFHISPHRLQPRLSFYKMWRTFYPEARKIFIDALRWAVGKAKWRAA